MQSERSLQFHAFRLDLANAQLWHNGEEIVLRRKTFEVLRYLVEHLGQLVTKDALLEAVWAGLAVGDSMPAICVGELRRVLGDDAKTPQLIETAHGRGYRFIAKVTTAETAQLPANRLSLLSEPLPIVVGRGTELELLRDRYTQALAGHRKVIFIAGEAGIGKTTFVRTFLSSLDAEQVRVGRGQCIEQYGVGEPYMPILEALTRLGQQSGGGQLIEILNQQSPSWLVQMPSLLSDSERARRQSAAQGVTQPRMLREMGAALDALSAETPLVLLLEDLHWSDFSTLELLASIARRTEPARLLILGTYRPVEMLGSEHPLRALRAELELHQQCEELRLRLLSQQDVAAYLEQRFAGDESESFERVASTIHARTEGNPLFMVNIIDYLVERGSLLEMGKIEAPRTIQQMIERNLEGLTAEEQAVLEAASVAGMEFSAAAVAAALGQSVPEIEARCIRLARQQQFIDSSGTSDWPDGTIASSFRFHHALYGNVLYDRLPAGYRIELHRKIAEREETAYGTRANEIAAELAHHYSRANDKEKAFRYYRLAGKRALRRSAYQEAKAHLAKALELLEALPQTPDRTHLEMGLCLSMTVPLIAIKGYTAPEVERFCNRARELSSSASPSEQFGVLGALASIYSNRGELHAFRQVSEQLLQIAQSENNSILLVWAHYSCGFALRDQGEFVAARFHLEQSFALYDPKLQHAYGFVQDPGATGLSMLSFTLFDLGYPDRALYTGQRALELARTLGHRYSIVYTAEHLGALHSDRGEHQAAQRLFEEMISLAEEEGYLLLRDLGRMWKGWSVFSQGLCEEGLSLMLDAFATYQHEDRVNDKRIYNILVLASAYRKLKRYSDGLQLVEELMALVEKTGMRSMESDVYRLKGELLRESDGLKADEAQRCFEQAIDIAHQQSGKSNELMATTSLARLLAQQGRCNEARAMLAEIYNWFTEGFDTLPLQEARVLLDNLNEKSRRASH